MNILNRILTTPFMIYNVWGGTVGIPQGHPLILYILDRVPPGYRSTKSTRVVVQAVQQNPPSPWMHTFVIICAYIFLP